MATPYLDPSQYDQYLASDLVERDDIEQLVLHCEAEVIAHYSRIGRDERGSPLGRGAEPILGKENIEPIADAVFVYLLHYETDAADVDTTDAEEELFLFSMRREIARLVRWRVEQRDKTPGIKTERRGMRTVTYRDDADGALPPNFGSFLKPFDIRPPTYAI